MRGDEEAFDELVGRVGDSLHSVARRILRDTNLAQDATQQALLDAWRHLPEPQGSRSVRGLDPSAPRECLLRRSASRTTSSRQPSAASTHRDGVSDETSRIATQDQLDCAFRRLSVEHRTVVVLVHYLGLSPTEAAERMGTPAGTARSRLHYALQQLRLAIEADLQPVTTRGTA